MKTKLLIIQSKFNELANKNMYLIQGTSNTTKHNWISEDQLSVLIKNQFNIELLNKTDDIIKIPFVDVEPFEEGYDVNTFNYIIRCNNSEIDYEEIDVNTYKTEVKALKYFDKLICSGFYN